ncbi:hypothetical protein ACI2K6_06785 [Microbacterium sp. NPDC006705]|uniref:hypothetical protein n=1 Tax=Microbacterium TaxID=33882 RepID=UPI00249DA888|nr:MULTISPECIES: hypothetical protein [Microbacterium]WHE36650.1 hypothetical protein P6897_02690 [Microbacterium sp. BDGP8]WRK17894.1 hypothetical protein VC184_02440 [Microbacterium plantarum]
MIEPVSVVGPSAPRPLVEVPGVSAVHDPRPPLTRVLGAAATALRREAAAPTNDILVSADGEVVTAAAAISVAASARTPEVARAVADELRVQYPTVDRITVQVRRIA